MCSYSIVENSKPSKGSGRHLLSASLMSENTYSAYIMSCNPHKNFITNIYRVKSYSVRVGVQTPKSKLQWWLSSHILLQRPSRGEASTSFFPSVMGTKTDRIIYTEFPKWLSAVTRMVTWYLYQSLRRHLVADLPLLSRWCPSTRSAYLLPQHLPNR